MIGKNQTYFLQHGNAAGICRHQFAKTPIAIVDIEATGVGRNDRVVEIAVVRCEPGEKPKIAFNSLINPEVAMGASHVHGIHDSDVSFAPLFREVAGDISAAIDGCVVGAYNASFDMRFLRNEYGRLGSRFEPPFICLMYLIQLLSGGRPGSLDGACASRGIEIGLRHSAAGDAMATASLWQDCRQLMPRTWRGFDDLRRNCKYAFTSSLSSPLPRSVRPLAGSSSKRCTIDPSTRAARIEGIQRAAHNRAQDERIFAARTEMRIAEAQLEATGYCGPRNRSPAFRLLAAEFALVLADIDPFSTDWAHLRTLCARVR